MFFHYRSNLLLLEVVVLTLHKRLCYAIVRSAVPLQVIKRTRRSFCIGTDEIKKVSILVGKANKKHNFVKQIKTCFWLRRLNKIFSKTSESYFRRVFLLTLLLLARSSSATLILQLLVRRSWIRSKSINFPYQYSLRKLVTLFSAILLP